MMILPVGFSKRPARLLLMTTIGSAVLGGWGVLQGNVAVVGFLVAIVLLGTIIPARTGDVSLWGTRLRPKQYPAPPKQLPFS